MTARRTPRATALEVGVEEIVRDIEATGFPGDAPLLLNQSQRTLYLLCAIWRRLDAIENEARRAARRSL